MLPWSFPPGLWTKTRLLSTGLISTLSKPPGPGKSPLLLPLRSSIHVNNSHPSGDGRAINRQLQIGQATSRGKGKRERWHQIFRAFHLACHSHQLKQLTVSFFHPQHACWVLLAEIVADKNNMWIRNTEKTFILSLKDREKKKKGCDGLNYFPSAASKFINWSPAHTVTASGLSAHKEQRFPEVIRVGLNSTGLTSF